MFRHAGDFTKSILAGALCLAGTASFSALAEPPDFAPNPSASWFAYSREFIPPPSGAGPVGALPGRREVCK
jgi:hypothetical protein